MKRSTSFNLSEEGKRLLRVLSKYFGVSQAGVIEMLVREKAREEGLNDTRSQNQDQPDS